MLTAREIHKSYGNLHVLKGVNLVISSSEIVSIVGSSGAGKSTLLHILGILDEPDSGEVLIEGKNIFALNRDKLATFRNQTVGFIFQFHNLLPEFTALENILIPGFIQGQSESKLKKKSIRTSGNPIHQSSIGS